MIGYSFWVAAGIALAALAGRSQHDDSGLARSERRALLLCAIGGAILGAYGLQLPADLLGWGAAAPAGHAPDALPLGGRTVLGGLLGGWIAVELGKRLARIARPTGDAFALPLALALGFGRIGCWSAGCCGGASCAPAWWASVDAAGTPRYPVQLAEALFHFCAAALLWLAARRGWARGSRLAIYLSVYAALRFALETLRQHPKLVVGLTYHQLLALTLLLLAGGTWMVRGARAATPQGAP